MGNTPNYGWNYPTVGADLDTWGDELNTLAINIDAEMFLKANKAAPTFTGPVIVNGAMDVNGVLDVDSIRFPDGSSMGTVFGGQTPWKSNINAAGFSLAGVSSIGVLPTTGLTGLDVGVAPLTATVGSKQIPVLFRGSSGNAEYLETSLFRKAAGSSWNDAAWRTQRIVDATRMTYVEHGAMRLAFGVSDAEVGYFTSTGLQVAGNVGAATYNGLGTQPHAVAPGANQIIRSASDGYIYASYISTVSGDVGAANIDRIYCSYDGFLRFMTPANFNSKIAPLWTNVQGKPGTVVPDASGTYMFYNTKSSAAWDGAAIQIRENALVSNTQTSNAYSPRISFHWANTAPFIFGVDLPSGGLAAWVWDTTPANYANFRCGGFTANSINGLAMSPDVAYPAANQIVRVSSNGVTYVGGLQSSSNVAAAQFNGMAIAGDQVYPTANQIMRVSSNSVTYITSLYGNGQATFAGNVQAASFNGSAMSSGTAAPAANTIVRTDGNGYLYTGYINYTGNDTAGNFNRVYVGLSDGFIRWANKPAFDAALLPQWVNIQGKPNLVANPSLVQVTAQSATSGAGFGSTGFQVVETAGGSGQTADAYCPRIAFHWQGAIAAQLGMNASGIIRTFNNPGTGYAPFSCGDHVANGTSTTTSTVKHLNLPNAGGGTTWSLWYDAQGYVRIIMP